MKQPKCEFQSRSRKATGRDIKGRRCMTWIQPGGRPSNRDPSPPAQKKFELHPAKSNSKQGQFPQDKFFRPHEQPREIALILNPTPQNIAFVGPPLPQKPPSFLYRFACNLTRKLKPSTYHIDPGTIRAAAQAGAKPDDRIETANWIINTAAAAILRTSDETTKASLRNFQHLATAYKNSLSGGPPTNVDIYSLRIQYYNLANSLL
jgi:hypothetical protein